MLGSVAMTGLSSPKRCDDQQAKSLLGLQKLNQTKQKIMPKTSPKIFGHTDSVWIGLLDTSTDS